MNNKHDESKNKQLTTWTIGHSVKPYKEFAELLKSADIQTVIDCRTKPRSRWPQYNGNRLEQLLAADDITYEHRGFNIGGFPGNVRFNETLDEIAQRSTKGECIALLCSEGSPQDCHRGTVLAPELITRGIAVEHLLYPTPQRNLL